MSLLSSVSNSVTQTVHSVIYSKLYNKSGHDNCEYWQLLLGLPTVEWALLR